MNWNWWETKNLSFALTLFMSLLFLKLCAQNPNLSYSDFQFIQNKCWRSTTMKRKLFPLLCFFKVRCKCREKQGLCHWFVHASKMRWKEQGSWKATTAIEINEDAGQCFSEGAVDGWKNWINVWRLKQVVSSLKFHVAETNRSNN